MVKKKILVITDTMPWGHRSIAKAFYSFLKSKEKELNIKVDYTEVKAETGIAGDIYMLVYRYIPSTNRVVHRLAAQNGVKELFKEVSNINLPNLKKVFNKYKPDMVISSYFYHSHSLVKWREDENLKFKLWTIAADPWTINQISFVDGADKNLLYDDESLKEAQGAGIEENKTLITGWWVRPEMYLKFDTKATKRKLGINDDRPVVFVGGGSLGTNALPKLLPVLLMIKTKVALIFNTGTDRLAYNMVAEYIRLFRRLRKNDDLIKIINLGWIDNMAEILGACDIVFGKAGPNFLFDVVATGKPMVAICHIGGQEDGNIELIRKKKLGWIKEGRGQSADFLLEYLADPEKYNQKFKETIKAEAEKNKKTWEVVEKELKKELE